MYAQAGRQWFAEEYEMTQMHTILGHVCLGSLAVSRGEKRLPSNSTALRIASSNVLLLEEEPDFFDDIEWIREISDLPEKKEAVLQYLNKEKATRFQMPPEMLLHSRGFFDKGLPNIPLQKDTMPGTTVRTDIRRRINGSPVHTGRW